MKPKTKLPRARVMHTELPQLFTAIPQVFHQRPMPRGSHTVGFPVLVLPMPSLKSARQRAKWENLSEGEKVEHVAKALFERGFPGEIWKEWYLGARAEECREQARLALAVMEGRA